MKKLLLSPLLAAQAAYVIAKADRLPEPEGPRQGQMGDGPPLRLLILGDSSAAGVGAAHQSKALSGQLTAHLAQHYALNWRLIAKTGATTKTTLAKIESLPEARYDLAVVALGVNDVTRLVRPEVFAQGQDALHETLRRRFGVRRILRSGLPPMGLFPLLPRPLRGVLGQSAEALDAALAEVCARDASAEHMPLDLPFEPRFTASDGFHPSEEAYAAWAALIAQRLLPI